MGTTQQAVLITGAEGGIGQSLCSAFRKAGYFTIATDVVKQGSHISGDFYISADLAVLANDNCAAAGFVDTVTEALSGRQLKGLVNNAALQKLGSLDGLSLTDFHETLCVNVTAPLLLTKLLLEQLIVAGGSVVNVGSIHADLTKPAFVSYATSKAALQGLSRALAVDLGGQVRVNVIQPAATYTEMLREGFSGNEKGLAALADYHPARRLALPEEVAATALFLVSDDCRFMTGAVINVDGGISARLHDPD